MRKFFLITFFAFLSLKTFAVEYDGQYGWPKQLPPKNIIICEKGKNLAERMLAESLAGLAAQAVNEGNFSCMIWNQTNNVSYNKLYSGVLKTLNIESPKTVDVWTLLDYLKTEGVVKGYVIYKLDKERENDYDSHIDTDYSSNVATVYCSLLKGVLIDETLETEAKRHKLKKLKDARVETIEECFDNNRDKLNNSSALSIPPSVVNLRDYAIAHRLMLYSDKKELIDRILEWVKPLSPILGWGCGDEFDFTNVISEWGHYNTATNWCINLPILSSLHNRVELVPLPKLDPSQIKFDDKYSYHSFLMSDGDNLQWTMGSFLDNKMYMGHQSVKDVGLSWSLCPINMSIASPLSWNSISEVKSPNMSLIEYGGGYQYPDRFALKRDNRDELLRKFAQRINHHLKLLNVKVFGFICRDVASAEAQQAFKIYAEEMDNIVGMMAVQYFPYELDGSIYWHPNKSGVEIPVVTSRYSLWNEVNIHRPRCGTPEYVASLINRDVLSSKEESLQWTIVHAWSDFSKSSNISGEPAIGVNPVMATERLLINPIKSVSAEELLWRIRMKYKPEQTMELINKPQN